MSTINSVVSTLLGRQDALSEQIRSRSIAPRTTGAADAPPPVRLPDSGDIRQRGVRLAQLSARLLPAEQSSYAAEIAQEGLTNISSLISDLRRLVRDAEHYENTTGREDVSLYQRQIDSVSRSIQTIADQTSFAGTKLLGTGGLGEIGFGAARGSGGIQPPDAGAGITAAEVTFSDPRVQSWGFKNYPLPESGSVDLDVTVTQSAQLAGLFLSMGSMILNLGGAGAGDGVNSQFIIEIGGVEGTQQLSFASGTTLHDVVAAINSFAGTTGVEASISGTGIALNSSDFGDDQFVSLKILDDGSIGGAGNTGAYTFFGDDSNAVDSSAHSDFGSVIAQNGISDSGQHVAGTINGLPTTGDGTRLRVDALNFQYQLTLSPDGAQTHNTFTALTIQRPDRTPPGGRALGAIINGERLDNAAADREPALELIGQAENEVAQQIDALGAFATALRKMLSESLSSAEGITGLDLDPEAARSTAALAVQAVLQDDPRGLVGALANFTPERTLSLLARDA